MSIYVYMGIGIQTWESACESIRHNLVRFECDGKIHNVIGVWKFHVAP